MKVEVNATQSRFISADEAGDGIYLADDGRTAVIAYQELILIDADGSTEYISDLTDVRVREFTPGESVTFSQE
jgi:hypothetical protein